MLYSENYEKILQNCFMINVYMENNHSPTLLNPDSNFQIFRIHRFRVFLRPYRQQPSPLLYSIDFWPPRKPRLTQRETNHYIARCASVLAQSKLAKRLPTQLVIDLFCTASVICCMLSIDMVKMWLAISLWIQACYGRKTFELFTSDLMQADT